jgi:hypothetical protein
MEPQLRSAEHPSILKVANNTANTEIDVGEIKKESFRKAKVSR